MEILVSPWCLIEWVFGDVCHPMSLSTRPSRRGPNTGNTFAHYERKFVKGYCSPRQQNERYRHCHPNLQCFSASIRGTWKTKRNCLWRVYHHVYDGWDPTGYKVIINRLKAGYRLSDPGLLLCISQKQTINQKANNQQ